MPCTGDRLPPLQTVRADFPHTAFPNLSTQGVHRKSTARRSQWSQAEVLEHGVERLPFRWPEGALTPTLQMADQPGLHVPIQPTERPPGVAVAKLVRPAPQPGIDPSDHPLDGQEGLTGTRQVPYLGAGSGLGLL